MTKETINPKRDIPKAMILTPLIVMFTYAGVAFGLTGIGIVQVSQKYFAVTAVAECFAFIGLGWMSEVIYIAAILGVTACALSCIVGQARIWQAIA